MASQTFANTGESAIEQSLEIKAANTPNPGTKDFEKFYEIDRTSREIENGDYKRITLQFPDELLHDSVPIYQALVARVDPSRELYVLADTSYGSCCVDEVAASHVNADAMVHYGHACLSQTSRLPVIYVFGQRDLNVDSCTSKIAAYIDTQEDFREAKSVIIKHDVIHAHIADDLASSLRVRLGSSRRVIYVSLPTFTHPAASTSDATSKPQHAPRCISDDCSRTSKTAEKADLTVWIGDESPTLTKLLLTSGGSNIVSYSPTRDTVSHESHLTNRLLMRRYALVQKARDSDVFGILVGTLGVASYLPLIAHIRSILKRAQKKSYTVSVGKINPSKLGNFMEIECWVWVACSEGMVDSKDYLRPIITPYELELALQPEPSWTGAYVLDFDTILANAKAEDGILSENTDRIAASSDDEDDRPTFSLVTGAYRHAKRYGNGKPTDGSTPSSALTRRDANGLALAKLEDSAAVQFLHTRTYQGLDPRLGKDEPGVLEQGRTGVASGYGEAN